MTTLRIAYHTTDEVYFDAAMQTAQECGASLDRLPHPRVRSNGPFAAVLYDLDHLESARDRAIVNELSSHPTPCQTAVHGYNLDDEQMRILHANGVIVAQKFDPEIIRTLCRSSQSPPNTMSDPKNRDQEESLYDPAALCANVRSLATQAWRALQPPSGSDCEHFTHNTGELRNRINQLQQQILRLRRQHNLGLEELQRWVDSLCRCVDGVRNGRDKGDATERHQANSQPSVP
jgi:hypothetical protein